MQPIHQPTLKCYKESHYSQDHDYAYQNSRGDIKPTTAFLSRLCWRLYRDNFARTRTLKGFAGTTSFALVSSDELTGRLRLYLYP